MSGPIVNRDQSENVNQIIQVTSGADRDRKENDVDNLDQAFFKNQVIRVTAGADRERKRGKPRIRLVANMHGGISFSVMVTIIIIGLW